MPLISAKNITKTYGQLPNLTYALKNVSMDIEKGEFTAIVGPSGSGKSTLMHIFGCLDKPNGGKLFLQNKEVSSLSDEELAKIRNQKIGFVFQAFNLLPRVSALENVELPLIYSPVPRSARITKAKKVLTDVGLAEKLTSTPAQLSGGEQQRVAIARALVNNPLVLFADEPTGNLDTKTGKQILSIFGNLNKTGISIILVTHDLKLTKFAKRIITLRDGQITSDKRK